MNVPDTEDRSNPARLRVLVVEDNAMVRGELERLIRSIPGGSVVFETPSAPQAIDWLDANPSGWDLAIIDMFLLQGHGFDVLKHCTPRGPNQRAVVLSNYARDNVPDHALRAGADRFFDKSLELDALIDYCQSLLAPAA